MKIGIATNFFPSHGPGGAERVAHRAAVELRRRGHDVFVLTTRPGSGARGRLERTEEPDIGRVYRVAPGNVFIEPWTEHRPFPLRLLWHLIDLWSRSPRRWMARLIAEERPDAVITHNLKGLGIGVARALRDAGLVRLHTIHDVQLSIPSGVLLWGRERAGLNRSWLRRPLERAMQRAFGSPDLVVAPSRFVLEFHRARGFFPDSRCEVLQNPVPEAIVARSAPRPPGPARLLFAGQLEEHKGLALLLEAFGSVRLDCELHVAGDGRLASLVAERAGRDPRINAHGRVDAADLAALLARMDATLVPSICYENSPNIVAESLGAGVPVLAADIGGLPEVVTPGVNGWLAAPGDIAGWSACLSAVVAEAPSWCCHVDRIRETVAGYGIREYAERLEQLLEEPRVAGETATRSAFAAGATSSPSLDSPRGG